LFDSIKGKTVTATVAVAATTISSEFVVDVEEGVTTVVGGALLMFVIEEQNTFSMIISLSRCALSATGKVEEEEVGEGTATIADSSVLLVVIVVLVVVLAVAELVLADDEDEEAAAEAAADEDNRGSTFSDMILIVGGITRFFLSLAPNVSLSLLAAS
jgi:hypothetical protein